MSFFHGLKHRLRVLLRGASYERELDEEMRHHLSLEAMQQQHAASGALTTGESAAQARRTFGNVTYHKESTRGAAGLALLFEIRQDVRFALRTFRRTPVFTAVAVLTLALGIGANTAIFSAVDTLLLRPLPFSDPARLMSVSLTLPPFGGDDPGTDDLRWSFPKFQAFREGQDAFSALSLWHGSQFTVRVGDVTVRTEGEYVEREYFPLLGIQPIVGRNFTSEETSEGGPFAAILGVRLWDQLFQRDPDVAGRTFSMDGFTYTVVGVAPESFRGLSGEAAFWMPLVTQNVGWGRGNPMQHNYFAVGRLADGVTVERAESMAREVGRRVDAAFPETRRTDFHLGAVARTLNGTRVDDRMRRSVLVLFGAVGLVLMIACANVANLFLVRASARRREIAVRLAIGAGRARLIRQLLAESLVLSLMGGAASVVVAWAGVSWLDSLQVTSVMRWDAVAGFRSIGSEAIRLNTAALAFAGLLAVVTGVVFGIVPAVQGTRLSLAEAVKDDGSGGRGRGRLTSRNVLVVAEIAIAVVLLAGAGLTIRSLGELLGVQQGFETDNVLTVRVNRAPEWSRDSISRFYDVGLGRLAAIPGVRSVAMIDCPPLNGCAGNRIMALDRPPEPVDRLPSAGVHWITPEWPRLMGVPLVQGRLFSTQDRPGGQRVALLSASAAQRLWPNEDPIGRPITMDQERRDTLYVVGVLGDVKFGPLEFDMRPDIYIPYHQNAISFRMMFFLKTQGDPLAITEQVRRALNEVAPGFPVYDVQSMEGRSAGAAAFQRTSALMLSLFAALALILAAIGTYGVISYGVTQRTREIGVRVALGATRRDVVRMIVGQGIAMAGIGAAIGLLGALFATRVIRTLLYAVSPTDPATLAGIVAVLTLAVVAASWIPARRAAGVPAIEALRGG